MPGVEFSAELCAIARQNCAIYGQRTGSKTRYRVIEADVVNYCIDKAENVFFMFNPFDDVIIKKVLDYIRGSDTQSGFCVDVVAKRQLYCRALF